MARRMKEDEKNEKIIRGLLKLPENRRCINCNNLGPQYVCTNFWIFICTTCSGIHREFTHRVKSISLAKFTSQEVTALQEGGNERARQIYFKEWDMQRNSLPSSSNPDRLREFIKHVYVERRYTGEKGYDKPPRPYTEEDSYRGSSQGKTHEDAYYHRYNEESNPGLRSRGYEQDRHQYEYRQSPSKNWQRDYKSGNERDQDMGSNSEAQSSGRPKDLQVSSPPGLRPMKDIISEKSLPSRKIDPPETDIGRTAHSAVHSHRRSASSSTLASTSGNSQEVKLEKSVSLIVFDADPNPPVSASSQAPVNQTINRSPVATNQDNWACFDNISEVKVSEPPKTANTVDSILSELSAPSVSSHFSGATVGDVLNTPVNNTAGSPFASAGSTHLIPRNANPTTAVPSISLSLFPQGGVFASTQGLQPIVPAPSSSSVSMQQQQQSLSPTSNVQSIQHPSQRVGIPGNQPWNMQFAPNLHQSTNISTAQVPLSATQPLQTSGVTQPPIEVKEGARKELPAELFTATYYPSFPAPAQGWQAVQPYGMGFPMQYNVAMTMPAFPQPLGSVNLFNPSEPSPAQPPAMQFPSMASLHGALPNVAPSSYLLQTGSLGSPSRAWMTPQGPYHMPAMPPEANLYASTVPANAYMLQQAPGNVPVFRHQEVGAFGLSGSSASAGTNHPVPGSFSAPPTPNPSRPATRNPFD